MTCAKCKITCSPSEVLPTSHEQTIELQWFFELCPLHSAAEELLTTLEYLVDKAYRYKAITQLDILDATSTINKAKGE